MSSYLYFPNNLKDIKDHIKDYIISCKENINLQLPYSFCRILLIVIEAAFISEQITECRFGALLEISDTFSRKLIIFSYMICQCWLN